MAAQVPSRLYRSRSQKMIAGVCGGLGEYFDVDPVLIRLLFVVTAFISGIGILAYIVLWIVVPFEGDESSRVDALKRDFDDLSGRVRDYVDAPTAGWMGWSGRDTPANASPSGPAAPAAGGAPTAAHPDLGTSTATDVSAAASTAATAPGAPGDPDVRPEAHTAYEASPMTAGFSSTSRASARFESADDDPLLAAVSGIAPDAPSQPASPPPSSPMPPPPPYDAPTGPAAGAPFDGPSGPQFGPPFGPPWSHRFAAMPQERRRRRQHWAGALLIVIGLLVLASNLGLLRWARPEYVIPLILITAGAWLLFGRGRRG